MKANEAPKKIYMSPAGVVYKGDKQQCNDIEYTRTDAFIEKAVEYLMDYEFNDSPTISDRRKRVDEFRKYMKGE